MISLISIIRKNLKIFARSRLSAIIIFLIPLLMVFLVGTAYSSDSLSGLQIGVYSDSYNGLTESIIDDLEESGFKIERFGGEARCLDSLKTGRNHVCVFFPADLGSDSSDNTIVFHVDNSRMNLAHTLINRVDSAISSRAEEIGVDMVENILTVLQDTKQGLPSRRDEITGNFGNLDEIGDKSQSVSLPSLSSSINNLKDARDLAEGSNSSEAPDIKDKIDSVISNLESAQNSYSSIDGSLEDIGSTSSNIKSALNQVSVEIDELIDNLSRLDNTTAESIIAPIESEVKPLHMGSTNWDFLFPTLVALMILFSSIILATSLVGIEKKSRAYFRNFITPTSDTTFLIGICLTCLIIMIIQLAILFAGSVYLTGLELVNMNVIISIVFVLLISSPVFIFLGMFIGYVFKSEETAVLIALSVAFLLMLFSNTIFPIEAITGPLKYLAEYNMFVITESILKQIILFNNPYHFFLNGIYILIAELVLFFSLAIIARKTTKRFI